MAFQTKQNVVVAYKAEAGFNQIAAAGAGATRFRPNGGGLSLRRATLQPGEIRADLKTTMGRLGSKSVLGSYPADLSVGTFDALFEAVMRGTQQAATAITQATMTSITTGVNTIVAAAGSWLTQGVRVGQVINYSATAPAGHPAANQNRNLRVVGVTATTITVAETLIVDATARTTFTLNITKRLVQPVVPVFRSFTVEEYNADIDLSEVFTGCRVSSARIAGGPDAMATVEFGFVGADDQPQTAVNSPYFTAPTLSPSIGLTLVDATLRFAGADIASLTGFDMSIDNRQAGQPVIGGVVTPNVFDNAVQVGGTVSGLRQDLQNVTRLINETELEFHALLVEPTAEPKNFFSIFIPRFKLTGADSPIGGDGGMIETMPFMVGDKEAANAAYDDTMVLITTSAP